MATFVAILGLWLHPKFASEIGEFRYFHGAFDEDTYILSWLRGTLRATRALSDFCPERRLRPLGAVAGYDACRIGFHASVPGVLRRAFRSQPAGIKPVGQGIDHIVAAACE